MGLSARQADVHLGWIEPLEETAQRVDDLKQQFAGAGRPLTLGLRTHLVIRDNEDEAWDAARRLIADASPEVKAQRQAAIVGTPMVGQQPRPAKPKTTALGGHLWNGLSEVRVNCGSALVGTPEQVADELLNYCGWASTSSSSAGSLTLKSANGQPMISCRWCASEWRRKADER